MYGALSIVGTLSEYADARILPSNVENKKCLNTRASEIAAVKSKKLSKKGSQLCESLNPEN